MRRLPVIAIAAVLAVAGLSAAAWLAPRNLDWSHLEPRIEAALGREVILEGPIRLDLLPRPQLTLTGLSAGDLNARRAAAVLDFGALLRGEIQVETLEISGAALAFDPALAAPLPALTVLPARRIRIEDSTVRLGGAVLPVEAAALEIEGPEGPYRLQGETVLAGQRYRTAASIGRWRGGASAAVSLSGDGFEASAIGKIAEAPAGSPVFSGRLRLQGEPAPGWNGVFDAEMTLGPDGVDLTGIDAAVAGRRFTGGMRAGWRDMLTIDADLATGLLSLDDWRERLSQLAGLAADAGLRVRLTAGAVRSGAWTARRVEAVLRRNADGLAVERFAAALPGGTQLEIAEQEPGSAAVSLRTKNLRALLAGLQVDPGAAADARLGGLAAEGRLRDLEVEGRLRLAGSGLTPEALRARIESADFALEEVRGRFDGARFEGRLARREGRYEARIAAENLPLDPYRPMLEGRALPPLAAQLDLARTRLFGVPVRSLELDAATGEDGGITISRLAVQDAGGVSGEAEGRFGAGRTMLRLAGRTTDLRQSADHYGIALPAIAHDVGEVAFEGRVDGASESLNLDVEARAGGRRLRLAGSLADQARFDGQVELEGPPPAGLAAAGDLAVMTASVSARRGHAAFDDIEIRLGAMRAHGRGAVSLPEGERPAARITLAADRFTLPAPAAGLPVWPRSPLNTAPFGDLDLDLDLEVEALGVRGEMLDDLRLDLSLTPEAWTVNAARAGWRGGRLLVDGGYQAQDGRAELKLELRDAVLPRRTGFGPAEARIDAFVDLAGEGGSLHGLVSTLSGSARIDFAGGRLNGVDPAAVRAALDDAPSSAELLRRLRAALVSGGSQLDSGRLAARFRNGVARPVAGGFALAGGRAALAGSVDLPGRYIDMTGRIALRGRPDMPPLGFTIAGPLDDPVREADTRAIEALLLSEDLAGLLRPSAN